MRHGNHTLTVYLNDSVANANPAALGDAAPHQTADLRRRGHFQPGCHSPSEAAVPTRNHTHYAVLHAETQLELKIRPLDEDSGDGRAAHNAEFDRHLVLQTLEHKKNQTNTKTPKTRKIQ